MSRRTPRSTRSDTLFPYTALFLSGEDAGITCFAGEPVGKSALNGSVPIGSQPEKAQVTYWLRQRLLRSSTKPLGVRARVSDRWRDLSRAAPEHPHLHRLQQDHLV